LVVSHIRQARSRRVLSSRHQREATHVTTQERFDVSYCAFPPASAVRAEHALRAANSGPTAGVLHGHLPAGHRDWRREGGHRLVRSGAVRRRRALLQLVLRRWQRGHTHRGDRAGLGRGQGELGARVRSLRVVPRRRGARPRRDETRVPDGSSDGQPVEGCVPGARRAHAQGQRERA
jgi:hypothetical protein